jgi:hypothetical protein
MLLMILNPTGIRQPINNKISAENSAIAIHCLDIAQHEAG